MKEKSIFTISLLFMIFSANPALANEPPAGQSGLAVILILPVMALLCLIGGAYPIMARLKKSSGPLNFIAAIIAILFGLVNSGATILVALIFGIYAFIRALKMIFWGLEAMDEHEKPDHLSNANSRRLIPAGVLLCLITLFLTETPIAYHVDLSRPYRSLKNEKREGAIAEFVAYQLAHARYQQSKGEQFLFDKILIDDPKFFEFFDISSLTYRPSPKIFTLNVRIQYNEDGKHFTIYMLPEPYTAPLFPYNYFTYQPSFRADESGKIRMKYVYKMGQECPADAPVVMSIEEKEISDAYAKYFAGIDAYSALPNKTAGSQAEPPSEPTTHKVKVVDRDGRFVALDNETVVDIETGLMWANKDNGKEINWFDGVRYCRRYRSGGYADWRMPAIQELKHLYKRNKHGFNVTRLIKISNEIIWSSNIDGNKATIFGFGSGSEHQQLLLDLTNPRYPNVLPVRKCDVKILDNLP